MPVSNFQSTSGHEPNTKTGLVTHLGKINVWLLVTILYLSCCAIFLTLISSYTFSKAKVIITGLSSDTNNSSFRVANIASLSVKGVNYKCVLWGFFREALISFL